MEIKVFKGWREGGKERQNKVTYKRRRRRISGCRQRKIKFLKSSPVTLLLSCPPLLNHCLSVLSGSGGSRWRGGKVVSKGGSQGELAVTQFFVHVPPQARHILLPEAKRLPKGQTLTVLRKQREREEWVTCRSNKNTKNTLHWHREHKVAASVHVCVLLHCWMKPEVCKGSCFCYFTGLLEPEVYWRGSKALLTVLSGNAWAGPLRNMHLNFLAAVI